MIAVDLVPMLGLLNYMLQLRWREVHRRREERVVLPLNYPLSHSCCNIEALLKGHYWRCGVEDTRVVLIASKKSTKRWYFGHPHEPGLSKSPRDDDHE
jgi:hypothetical protein